MKKITEQESQNILMKTLSDFISNIPNSTCSLSTSPSDTADSIISKASWKAAATSGTAGLVPGPFGLASILPELVVIWKIQAQMVADIAATYGKTGALKQETMMYCLFKHGGSHLFKDIVLRVGERVIVKRASLRIVQQLLANIGARVTQRIIGKAISRWIPFVGAAAVGAYAKYDTKKIGEAAKELFSSTFEESSDVECDDFEVA